jgi:hypothetical protein
MPDKRWALRRPSTGGLLTKAVVWTSKPDEDADLWIFASKAEANEWRTIMGAHDCEVVEYSDD